MVDRTKDNLSSETGSPEAPSYEIPFSVAFSGTSTEVRTEGPRFQEYIEASNSLADENLLNLRRLAVLKQNFTEQLIRLITEEEFEYGIANRADYLVSEQIRINASVTKEWLNSIFLENFNNVTVVVGILRVIARIDYFEVYPHGQTMAVAALSHEDIEVQDCGVRAFESWGTLESLKVLQTLKVATNWLQEYIDEVVSNLEEEYRVSTGKKDR